MKPIVKMNKKTFCLEELMKKGPSLENGETTDVYKKVVNVVSELSESGSQVCENYDGKNIISDLENAYLSIFERLYESTLEQYPTHNVSSLLHILKNRKAFENYLISEGMGEIAESYIEAFFDQEYNKEDNTISLSLEGFKFRVPKLKEEALIKEGEIVDRYEDREAYGLDVDILTNDNIYVSIENNEEKIKTHILDGSDVTLSHELKYSKHTKRTTIFNLVDEKGKEEEIKKEEGLGEL